MENWSLLFEANKSLPLLTGMSRSIHTKPYYIGVFPLAFKAIGSYRFFHPHKCGDRFIKFTLLWAWLQSAFIQTLERFFKTLKSTKWKSNQTCLPVAENSAWTKRQLPILHQLRWNKRLVGVLQKTVILADIFAILFPDPIVFHGNCPKTKRIPAQTI